MEDRVADTGSARLERLLLEVARAHQWTGMYPSGHPFLRERIAALHQALSAQAAAEPDGTLLIGVTRDKVMYQGHFLETRHPIVVSFAEELYRHHVATFAFGPEASPEDLLAFFRCLRKLQAGEAEELPEGYLEREGVRGIWLSPVNYRQVLSRGIAGRAPVAAGETREEALWKNLMTAPAEDGFSTLRAAADLSDFPDILPAILRRARAVARHAPPVEAGGAPERVSGDALRGLLRHLGRALKSLPEHRRDKVLECMEEGLEDDAWHAPRDAAGASRAEDLSVPRELLSGYTNAEYLELLAGLLSLKGKKGKRLLESFAAIASERDVRGALLPLLRSWSAEGRHAKEYYDDKTWTAVEKLLLERSEEAYLGDGHARFLESLSAAPAPPAGERRTDGEPDAAPTASLDPGEIRRKGIVVLLDLLLQDRLEAVFEELLAEVQEAVPWMMEEREFELLRRTLEAVRTAGGAGRGERGEPVSRCLASVDFRRFTEIYLSVVAEGTGSPDAVEILVQYGATAADPLLDRLLVEPEKEMRRVLLALLVRIGEPAVPSITARFGDLPWFFLRNLSFILGEIGVVGTVEPLVRMTFHKERRVRREAVQALGKLRAADPDAVSALGRILLAETLLASPKEDSVRVDAANALYQIGGAEALSLLYRGKAVRRAVVRGHCERLLRARVPA